MLKQAAVLFLIVFSWTVHLSAQNTGGNPALAGFNAQRSGDHVIVTWTIRSGFSCASVNVLHSTDSVNFSSIYEYPGICGASSQDESYSFTHTTPSTGKNYYKLDLGTYGTSSVVVVNMISYSNSGLIITGGTGDKHEVYFSNPANTIFSLELFDSNGKLIYTKGDIEGDRTDLPVIPGANSIIILRLSGNDGTIYEDKYVN